MVKTRNILIVFPFNLFNEYGGGFTRVKNDIKVLQSLGYHVTVLSPSIFPPKCADEKDVMFKGVSRFFPFLNKKNRMLLDLHTLFFNPSFKKSLKSLISINDVCFVHFFSAASPAMFFSPRSSRIVFVNHDFEYNLARQLSRNVLYSKYVHVLESHACKSASAVITVSDLDASAVSNEYAVDQKKIKTIPNYIDVDLFNISILKEHIRYKLGFSNNHFLIIFHGLMSTRPNSEALKFIVHDLAPTLLKVVPDSQILIVGSEIPEYAKKSSSVSCYENIENIGEFLRCADVAIVPLLLGGGTRLKILECFASRLPVISTKKGAEGIEYFDGEHLLISDRTVSSFIKSIEKIKDNRIMSQNLAANGFRIVNEKYSFQAATCLYSKLIRRLEKA